MKENILSNGRVLHLIVFSACDRDLLAPLVYPGFSQSDATYHGDASVYFHDVIYCLSRPIPDTFLIF